MFGFHSLFRKKVSSQSSADQQTTIHKELLDMQEIEPASIGALAVATPSTQTPKLSRVNSPLGIDPKAMAKAAAARIDAIEQEIALDLRGSGAAKIGMHPRASSIAIRSGLNRVAPPPGIDFDQEVPENEGKDNEVKPYEIMPEMAHTLLLGETNLAAVIEVTEVSMSPVVEEAAVLYANEQLEAAVELLERSFKEQTVLGDSEFNAYRMLLDLLRYQNDSVKFDRYAIDFATRFEKSPPTWLLPKHLLKDQTEEVTALNLGEMLDGSIVAVLEQLKVVALQSKRLKLDASNITQINYKDGFGCELLLRVMNAFENTDYELELVGATHLFQKIRPFIQMRHKDISGHLWLLYLELLRLQNQQLLFEDLSMKFCDLYEVSPPSWRKPTGQVHDAASDKDDLKKILIFERPDYIHLTGTINSNSDKLINQIAIGLHENPTVVCDCLDLRLISFEAAGRLLTALTAWSAELKTVEFKNLNNPIATLFVVLGIQHLAVVERRRES